MPLVVYKSSAGSGKTTTLVQAYLKITLNNPSLFRHVLAITFTNKAANEMKERVLDWLKILSEAEFSKKEELKDLQKQLGFTDDELKNRAKKLFSLIIHNYDEFSISTIDSFVHRIIKTFTTDIKLPQNFEVVVEEEEIIPEIIQDLYEKVGVDKDITNILVNFVISNFEDERAHDPTNQLYSFIQKQIQEEGFFFIRKLQDKSLADFQKIISNLRKQQQSLKRKIKKHGCNAIDLIHNSGIEPNCFFRGKSGIYGYFLKNCKLSKDAEVIPNKTSIKSVEENIWYPKKCPEDQKSAIDKVTSILEESFNTLLILGKRYLLLSFVYRKIYDVALIREIRELFDEYASRNQKVHISEFNKKISESIAGQPVPFIYERLGRRYRYFLIDEFQDTSILQWQNLLPLIEESLAYDNFNMLVGDAKQAIYRFRNGEVELFSSLPKLYPEAKTTIEKSTEKFLNEHYDEVILDMNYRSDYVIVDFNNRFFQSVKNEIKERNKKVYNNHVQRVKPEKEKQNKGYVKIELIETEKVDDYREKRLDCIKNSIDELLNAGYANKDICVLTNQNKYAAEIASFLIESGYKIISHESLLLKNSPEVRMIIALMQLLIDPEERIHLAYFIENMLIVKGSEKAFQQSYTNANKNLEISFDELMNSFGYPEVRETEIRGLSVYEMVEYAVSKFFGESNNNIFLHFFLDFAYENQNIGDGSLASFIEYWEKKCDKTYISMPDGIDAIQLMTIHKAKGLKFESVILDFIPRNKKITKLDYWSELSIDEFNELQVGMLPITDQLEFVGLEDVYTEEIEKTELDLLNMIYVAFTRPVSALFIVSQKKEKTQNRFTKYLQNFLGSQELSLDELLFEFGTLTASENKNEELEIKKINMAEEESEEKRELKDMTSSSWEGRIKVAPADTIFWEQIESKPTQIYGKLLHNILSEIFEKDDVERVINKYLLSGIIDEAEAGSIKNSIKSLVNHKELKKYFSSHVVVKNETEIIIETNEGRRIQRPDRVVITDGELAIIDYKTGEKDVKHNEQINDYGDYFKNLGYQNIKKLLVYINDEIEIVKVG